MRVGDGDGEGEDGRILCVEVGEPEENEGEGGSTCRIVGLRDSVGDKSYSVV